jgi:hypothetical protein
MAKDDAPPELADREAILARRRRFIALAISGIATAGCDKPLPEPEPQPCLSVRAPEPEETGGEAAASKPFVEEPGVPLASETEGGETGGAETEGSETDGPEAGEGSPGPGPKPAPRPCLNVAPKQPPSKPQAPRPCLLVELSAIDTRDDEHG